MKHLILVRHAKSDWPVDTEDFDRPLADKGLQDALKMSKFLKNNDVAIDYLLTSPSVRTLSTCKIFSQTYRLDYATNEKLYNPSENNFLSAIYNLKDDVNSVVIFSHNNGISNFANSMSDNIFHLPTCGVVGFQINCESWSQFDGANKKFLFFHEPNKI